MSISTYDLIAADFQLVADIVNVVKVVCNVRRTVRSIRAVMAARKQKRNRSCWRREWIARREVDSLGTLHQVHNELATEDPLAFKNYLRMDSATFDKLLSLIDGRIAKKDTNMRQCISSRDKLSVTLRFLATGETYTSLSVSTRIPACTISLFVPIVCREIYAVVKEKYVKIPQTEDEWLGVSESFERMWNFPNCLGAMDGKHIAFRPPRSAGSKFRNYKCFDSIILLALVDAKYKFLYIDVGTNGRVSDGGVFRESGLFEALEEDKLGVPLPRPLPGRETPVPFVIVADDAFSLARNLMKPFPNRQLSIEQRIHNYRLSRARRVSENVFGIFANRFRIFLGTINLSPEKVEIITLAACALHNFLQMEGDTHFMSFEAVDREEGNGNVIPGGWRNNAAQLTRMQRNAGTRSSREPATIRQEFSEYFNGGGAVPWQNQHIFNA